MGYAAVVAKISDIRDEFQQVIGIRQHGHAHQKEYAPAADRLFRNSLGDNGAA